MDSDELGGSGVEGVAGGSLALGALDDGSSGVLSLLLDDSLELDGNGVGGGTVELLGVGEPLPDGVTVELLALGVGALLLDSLEELLSADEDELDDEELVADEMSIGPLLGGSTLEEGMLSLLDGGEELDGDELLDDPDVEVEGAELDEELPLEEGWLLDDELDDELLELSDEELLLELLDEGRLDDGSLLLLENGSLEDELDEGSLDELDDDELEELLLDDELLMELLDDDSLEEELELLLDDDSLLEDELEEELLDELLDDDELDELLDDGSLDEELELLLLEELDDELLLEELELDDELDELDELGGSLDELDELDGHGHFGTQIFLPQIVISQQSPASCTSKCAHGSGADVLGLDDELVSQQMGTSQSSPSSTDTSCPHTNVSRCVGNRIVSPYRSGQGSSVSTVVVSP